MKRPLGILLLLIVLAAATLGLIFAYRVMRVERDQEAASDTPVIAPSRVIVTAAGVAIRLDVETQRRLGLESAVPRKTVIQDEVTATARVLDGSGLAAQLAEIRAAESALEATRSDHERKRLLAEHGENASVSAVERAAAAMTKDMVVLEMARSRVAAEWGPALAARSDLAALGTALLHRKQAIARVELLATDVLQEPPVNVRLGRFDGFHAVGQLIGPAPSSDNPLAGQCLLYLVAAHAEQLVSGTMLIAWLARPGKKSVGWIVPRSAVVRYGGLAWIYVRKDKETFIRRAVALDHAQADGWIVIEDMNNPVIVTGAQALLSEELKGSLQMKG